MVEQLLVNDDYYVPDANQLVTEDDTPVDNLGSETQQRLLTSTLYSSWQERIFLAAANVGIYNTDRQPAIVPDVFLSLDVQVPQNWWEKQNRCYLVWIFGKLPELVIEIASNRVGDELGGKLQRYEQMRVSYYIVFDPMQQLGQTYLHIFELRGTRYYELTDTWLEQVGIGLTLWQGEFEGKQSLWLRWCYQDGTMLLTGDERAQQAEQRAQQAEQRAQQAEQRAQLLAERLRSLGIDPNAVE